MPDLEYAGYTLTTMLELNKQATNSCARVGPWNLFEVPHGVEMHGLFPFRI